MNILVSHDYSYSTECVMALHKECSIPLSEMQSIWMCLCLARKNPSHLERGMPTQEELKQTTEQSEVVKEAVLERKGINDGLKSFQLKPKDMKGEALFGHMVDYRRRMTKQDDHKIGDHLMCSPKDKF